MTSATPLLPPVRRGTASVGPWVEVARVRRAAVRRATAMLVLRRIHLYSGLFLLPWVLIYGISAFLFNRGGAAAPRELGVPAADAVSLQVSPEQLGGRLLAAVAAGGAVPDTSAVRGAWTYEFRDDGRSLRLTVPLDGANARLTERPARTGSATLPRTLFDDERKVAERVARGTLTAAGFLPDALRLVDGPSLVVTRGERRWSTTLSRDSVNEGPIEEFEFGRLMRRLHVTHGYSPGWARVAWAVIVDVMAAAMVTWAASGLLMWWQKRSLRGAGSLVLGAAILTAVVMVVALYSGFSS